MQTTDPLDAAIDAALEGTLNSKSKEPTEQDLRRAGIDMLARREHSCVEMRRKLAKKFKEAFSAEQIDNAVEILAAEGLQSDLRFAESYTRSKYERGDGPYKIKAALQQRGIHSGLIERVLNDEQLDWQRRAALLYQRKFPRFEETNERGESYSDEAVKQRAKEMRFLQSRGFPKEMIYSVVS